MQTNILSDIELYYSKNFTDEKIILENEEAHHAINVMRNKVDDIIFVTNGNGLIAKTKIESVSNKKISALILEKFSYSNNLKDYVLCIPHIKKQERLEFALEKSVELGFTNFIIYDSDRSIAKGDKSNRWEKILISAMKQSLQSYLPKIEYKKNLQEILNLEGRKILFDQKSNINFNTIINYHLSITNLSDDRQDSKLPINYFIFGPEGGFSDKEMYLLNEVEKVYLTKNRLRSETAIITAASIISTTLTQ